MSANTFGVAHLSIVPMRAEPSDNSEMVNQLLFGEIFSVLAVERQWRQIKLSHDSYIGWIDEKQYKEISKQEHAQLLATTKHYVSDLIHPIFKEGQQFLIPMGSMLYQLNDGVSSVVAKDTYVFYGNVQVSEKQFIVTKNNIISHAFKYLCTPYLWGGRSALGIDCSGFTQMVFRLSHINLKRDAYQQAQQGTLILDFKQAQVGDLAFFSNAKGKITHVGIILDKQQIIHASGEVRIDQLTEKGIYNRTRKQLTHKLTLIKRFLSSAKTSPSKPNFPRRPLI